MNLQISSLLKGYRDGSFSVREVVDFCLANIENSPDAAWIYKLSKAELDPYIVALENKSPENCPLFGVPFVIKDNIDLANVPTTAACPDFEYVPEKSAFVVKQLIDAGAIPLAKSNLDQFATGLVGTRSPYGECPNSFDVDYISGGSSSGSAVAVALNCCSFSLGTDTAGSGRVPAAFNNLIGLKPSKGLLSCRGVVPACRSLDCVSIFALDSADAKSVFDVASVFDPEDCFARKLAEISTLPTAYKFGVPKADQLKFFGDSEYETAFYESVALLENLGAEKVEIDFQPFIDAANLLYYGPWVNERFAAVGEFIEKNPSSVLETTRKIITSGLEITAPEVFKAMYKLNEFKRATDQILADIDFMVTPTAGSRYKRSEIADEPILLNTNLGYYTNYMNLLDYASIAVPTKMTSNLPFGVTLVSFAGHDKKLLQVAGKLHAESGLKVAKTEFAPVACSAAESDFIDVAVCGAHLKGFPLNRQLTDLKATFVCATKTAPEYRMFAFESDGIKKPGLIHDVENGASIYLEIYRLTPESFGEFVNQIPAPLGIGKVVLESGDSVSGFIAEPIVSKIGKEITELGDWRKFQ